MAYITQHIYHLAGMGVSIVTKIPFWVDIFFYQNVSKKYTHGLVLVEFIIHQDLYHTLHVASLALGQSSRLLQCQWSNPEIHGSINHMLLLKFDNITTTKQSKTRFSPYFVGSTAYFMGYTVCCMCHWHYSFHAICS